MMTRNAVQGLEPDEVPTCRDCGNERPRKHSLGRCLSCYRRELSKRHRQRDRRCPACGLLFLTSKTSARFCSGACTIRGAR